MPRHLLTALFAPSRRLLHSAALAMAMTVPLGPAHADDPGALAEALKSAAARDWPVAMGRARVSGPVAYDILEWQRLRAGEGTFAEFSEFAAGHADWPGMPLLRQKAEAAIPDGEDPAAVIAWFDGSPAVTGAGALALAAALDAEGQRAEAETTVVAAWRSMALDSETQARFADRWGDVLAPHHDGRMARMLNDGRIADARRMLPLVSPGTRSLADARIALQTSAPGVDTLLRKIPERLQDSPWLAFDRFRWRIRQDLYEEAAQILLERSERPGDPAANLGDPDKWAEWRAILARREMRLGNAQTAYRIAASHHLKSGTDYADLEWLAGFIALRRLDDPDQALSHFMRFELAVGSPISLGRAGYWQGRAYEAQGRPDDAREAFTRAARWQTGFYGLLAAERIGLTLDPALIGGETYPDWREASFVGHPVFRAAMMLYAAGDREQCERFLLHLADSLGPDDIAALAGLGLQLQEPHIALVLAKVAAAKGRVLPAAYFPLNGLESLDLPVPAYLALAIARRESEFDAGVISHAGARGLMQVMPETAKRMAARIGLGFDQGRLTSDWQYNARIGSAYLDVLRDEFGPSAAMIAAGYNAGPGRPRNWARDFGDPRTGQTDIVDWIEMIPFTETRNYVMRVGESLPVYRARLSGASVPIGLTAELTGPVLPGGLPLEAPAGALAPVSGPRPQARP